jgi:hypothetical protein
MLPVVIEKHPLNSFFIKVKLPLPEDIKKDVFSKICVEQSESLFCVDDYYTDNISYLDWGQRRNWSRPWVNSIKPYLDTELKNVFNVLGYHDVYIEDMWFQRYLKNSSHGWHVHGSTFTAVYYLNLPENAPKTELIEPFNQEKIFIPNVTEGDLLIFPSYVIHRAPVVIDENISKTIISFNLIVDNPLKEITSKALLKY